MGSQPTETSFYEREPIAVVGSSCRLPGGASSPSKLWELLREPRDVVQEIPASRFNTTAFHHTDSQHHGSANVKHAYLLEEDPRAFDRDFFAMNPKEAEAMDPQQRMLLETVYESIESGGYSIQKLKGSSTAVFVGVMSFDYQYTAIRGIDTLPQYHATGAAMSILANRVSYFYDWRGPSVSIDTACSSSLVALHQGVTALRNGDADMAVAAGSNLIIGPEPFISESKLNMLSPNGRSHMWDASADGYTRGEGFSVVLLKRLSQAIADGDQIECIIRETGVNSDGKTPGITMPSSDAQARLIRDVYARCGLDPARESDRPQYFEAHGTGTPTGDPIEARAIQSVFFPDGARPSDDKLLVGSIKTIVGHTEGTAGLAGLLKVSLALQHGQIPANLHFNHLSPRSSRFNKNLHIPTELTPWPAVPHASTPRRASMNSFGFGGTNAHAIVESWDGPGSLKHDEAVAHSNVQAHGAGPFILSANSGTSLKPNAAQLASFLRANPETDLGRLAYSLFKRTDLPYRAAFSATTAEGLAQKLEDGSDALKGTPRAAQIPPHLPPRILGVFTGQGAQWPTMGRELYEASSVFRAAMMRMQQSLDSLPEGERPSWNLVEELGAPAETSRVGQAAISQPICTALQVALVDVLRAAGVGFSAVVGHSSGEIGAAYAAGYLEAKDAIRIAYLRGLHSSLAQGPGGKRGKMMAVGMSLDEAAQFCRDSFDGAIVVAASNSPTSCTLSGNADEIDEAKRQLDEKGTFARVLAVDTAYHSHHMLPCARPYLESIKNCGVRVRQGPRHCPWYSSVWGANGRSRSFDDAEGLQLIEGQYWVDNLTLPVLFSQAVERALGEDQRFDASLEVGPHPALKGPSSETTKKLTRVTLPYAGVLKRGENAVEALADALGFLWKTFPSSRPIVTFEGVRRAFHGGKLQGMAVLKGLPPYSWDHDSLIWKESRASRNFRVRDQPAHELLGHAITHGEHSRREVHWKQVFRLSEMPWLRDHKIQNQVFFPGMGFLAMTQEAAVRLVDGQKPVRLLEIFDADLVQAITLEEDSSGIEVLFTVKVVSQTDKDLTAEVACYSGSVDAPPALDTPQTSLMAHFSARVRLLFGEPSKNALPRRSEPALPMHSLDMEQVYSNLSKEGFGYTDSFQAKAMLRRLNHAVVTMSSPPASSSLDAFVHPAPLDTGIQGLVNAFSFPGDGRLTTAYVPTRIAAIRVSMATPDSSDDVVTPMADCVVTSSDATGLDGSITLFNGADGQVKVQMRGIRLAALGQRNRRWLYSGEVWQREITYGMDPGSTTRLSDDENLLYEQLVRTAYFYLRQLRGKIRPAEVTVMGKFRKHMMKWITDHLFPQIEAGEHPDVRPEWKNDTLEMVQQWRDSRPSDNNDMNLLHAMGQNLIGIIRGTVPALKVLVQDGMLDRLYVEGIGFKDGNMDLGSVIQQIGHQHPRMRIVEIGAGTGGTTRTVLNALETRYASYTYTYTDISTGFFENARSVFSDHIDRLTFKTLNIENDPADQGFADGSFDMVISSNCLHATTRLEETLRHCRKLLRPGGRLVLLEITRDFLPIQLIMSTLPGWFLGVDEGRTWAPTVSLARWDELLKATGFSGVDMSSTPSFCSVIMSQAVDETIQILREPLAAPQALPLSNEVLIVGSGDSELVSQTEKLLRSSLSSKVTVVPGLEGIQVPTGAVVLSLCDVESPVFCDMNAAKFAGIQDIMKTAHAVLWVSSGAKSGKHPEANMLIGMGSTLRVERSDHKLQFLDVDDPATVEPSLLAKLFLRLALWDQSKTDEMLWVQEPELVLRDGVIYLPRIMPLEKLNRRSAARIRPVPQSTSLASKSTAAVLRREGGAFLLRELPLTAASDGETSLQVSFSSLNPIITEELGPVHVSLGRDVVSGDRVLVLSSTNSSTVTITQDRILHRWSDDEKAPSPSNYVTYLRKFLERALAAHLLDDLDVPTWIHGAPKSLSEAIDAIAHAKNLSIFQTTSDLARASEASFCHPYASDTDLQDMRPKDIKSFIDVDSQPNESLLALIHSSLAPSSIRSQSLKDLTVHLKLSDLSSLANEAIFNHLDVDEDLAGVISVAQVSTTSSSDIVGPAAIVDWSTHDAVTTLVSPLDHRVLFSPDKTYILFGMTGDLGTSVCQWMVENGAVHVVLTSRNPNVPPQVLDFLARKGANVRTMAVDISDIGSLRAAHQEIKSSMPPVGGVMNGAMVLRDRIFEGTAWEDFAAVLAPKVQGTRNIDEVFSGGDGDELEFFICFSSASSIVGIIGQSAYAAANHYMAGLTSRRRARGLAASIVHMAALTGLGYIYHRGKSHTEAIDRSILPRLTRHSETDLHNMLGEAIVCGRPRSGEQAELIAGIATVFKGSWPDDPRFSCYLGQRQVQDDESSRGKTAAAVSVETQLSQAEDPSEHLTILEMCFKQALGNMLEIDPENIDRNTPVASLGIDSLIAIRIREWFLKEVGIEVPVLKLMSVGFSLSRMCDDVLVEWRKLKKDETDKGQVNGTK